MSKKQWRISITIDKELYEQLEERAEKEARTLASLGKYLLLKGIETENGNGTNTTQEDEAAWANNKRRSQKNQNYNAQGVKVQNFLIFITGKVNVSLGSAKTADVFGMNPISYTQILTNTYETFSGKAVLLKRPKDGMYVL